MIKLENETGTHYIIQRHERFNIDQLVPGDVLILRRNPRRAMNSEFISFSATTPCLPCAAMGCPVPTGCCQSWCGHTNSSSKTGSTRCVRPNTGLGDKVRVGHSKGA